MAELFDLYGGVPLATLAGQYGMYVVETDAGGAPLRSRFVPLSTLKTWVNTDPSIVPSSSPWRGCRVVRTSTQSVGNAAFDLMSWQTATVDTDGIFSVGAPTRLTVPTGVTRVRLSASVGWALNATGQRMVSLLKNGSIPEGSLAQNAPGLASLMSAVSSSSGSLAVTAGDYFELRVAQTSGGSLNALETERTWFEMEILEAS